MKQSILISLFFMAVSCGKGSKSSVSQEPKDTITHPRTASVGTTMPASEDKPELESFNSSIKHLPPSLAQFIPEGYSAIDTTFGDLNLDPYTDLTMVLKSDKEGELGDTPRPLLLLLGEANSAYTLAAKNDQAVYCLSCGGAMGDPFMDVVIKRGYFSIEHYGGGGPSRFTRTTTFKYSVPGQGWYLYKDGWQHMEMNPSNDPDAEAFVLKKEDIKTQKDFSKIVFQNFNINKEE